MADVRLPGPEGPDEENTGPGGTPQALRGRMAVLGRFLFDTWPTHGHDWDVTYSMVTLLELGNALLNGDDERAAQLLAELDRQADR